MKITKFGHCCLLIEEDGVRTLTDPGSFTTSQNEIKNIDIVIISHEHGDHLHIGSLKEVLKNNPDASIITNSAVGALLQNENIVSAKIVEDGQELVEKGICISAHGTEHAEIYENRNRVMNTGYFIGKRLFYPGDSFHDPKKPVDVLALPVAGPWCKIKDSINYFLKLKPKKVFPVHDGLLNEKGIEIVYTGQTSIIAKENSIEFIALEIGKETEL